MNQGFAKSHPTPDLVTNEKAQLLENYNKNSSNLAWTLGTTTYPVNHEFQGSLGLTYQTHAMMNATWAQATLKMRREKD